VADGAAASPDAVVGKLGELGFELPQPQSPVTKYRWAVRDGDVVYLAGHGPFVGGQPRYQGKVGRELTVEQGYDANRVTALAILRTLKDELGSLEHVVRPLSQVNYVNVVEGLATDFIEVGNGSTDLWAGLWGEDIAYCARITVGASELPMGVPTAITSVWKVR